MSEMTGKSIAYRMGRVQGTCLTSAIDLRVLAAFYAEDMPEVVTSELRKLADKLQDAADIEAHD